MTRFLRSPLSLALFVGCVVATMLVWAAAG